MNLGAFSISLNVSDLIASKEFYEKLGFSVIEGKIESDYFILKNNDTIIGLYQDMFAENVLTFNPVLTPDGTKSDNTMSVQIIQEQLKEKGIELIEEVETEMGPGRIVFNDPDGNRIEIEQRI